MHATLQVKVNLEKANQLEARLEELKKVVGDMRGKFEKELKTTKDPIRKVELEAQLELMKELELDVSITNLLRASIDFAMEKLLPAPDSTLIAALHASKAPRGRPQRRSK